MFDEGDESDGEEGDLALGQRSLPPGSPEPAVGPTVASGMPCLLLVPRPWAVPTNGLVEAFRSWVAAIEKRPTHPEWRAAPLESRWRHFSSRPVLLGETWDATRDILELAAEVPAAPKARQEYLKRRWEQSPWLFGLAPGLLREARSELKLPDFVDGADVVLAVRGARPGGWLTDVVAERTRHPSAAWLHNGSYEALVNADERKTLAAAFLDGGTDGRALMSRSRTVKDNDAWRRRLAQDLVEPMLVPLSLEPNWDDEPNLESWAARWLTDGRAQRALWFVFGRSVQHFRWRRVTGPQRTRRKAAAGMHVFDLVRGLEFEPTPDRDHIGLGLRWMVGEDPEQVVAPNVATQE